MIAPDTDAQPATWTGPTGSGGDGNWSDPALWSGGDVPFHPTDHVQLDSSPAVASNISLDMNAGIGGIQLDDGDSLDVTQGNTLTLFGPNPSNFAGGFSNHGTFALLNGTSATTNSGGTHTGAFSLDAGTTLQFAGGTNVLAAGSSVTGAGGVAVTGGTLILNGTSTHTGPTNVAGGTLVVGNADAIGGGSPLSIGANGIVVADVGLGKAISVASVTTSAGGKLDVTTNAMVVRGSTLAAVQSEVAKAFNGGAWDAPIGGITSANAAADPLHVTAIGCADNAVLGRSDFHGVSGLSSTDVLVAYTYYGDADLTGSTTLDDFTLFLYGYQHSGMIASSWANGDFDYSGGVTLDDFTLFLKGYQQQGPPLTELEALINSISMDDADRAAMLAAVQAVPEPAALGLLALSGAAGLLRRRRRWRPRRA
jgi:autotransporter-associated beta strand protein